MLKNKEIIFIIETIAQEKSIPVDSVIEALEEGIKLASRRKYGHDLNIECRLDKKTGEIFIYNSLEIVADNKGEDFNSKKQIAIKDAEKGVKSGKLIKSDEVEIGNSVRVELPSLDDLSVVAVQIAKNEIFKKIKDAERDKEYKEFIDREKSIVNGMVKKIGLKNTVIEVDGYETLLTSTGMIPGERLRIGDRVRAYVKEVKKEQKGAQIFLSRTDNMFLAELFKQGVPEIYDGVIEILGIARDPGSKAKIAVFSRNETSDVVGACVGVRGVRVQSITSELKGERIDVIRYSDDPIEYIVNAISPAKPIKVIYDEAKNSADIVLTADQLSLAIGRGGQNVRLASKITGIKLDVMTEEDEKKKRLNEFKEATKTLIEKLDIEEIIAQLLVSNEFDSVESIADSNVETLTKIDEFDESVAIEIFNRATDYLNK
ncbi:MAG: transcription termination factor NusA [Rickettsiales bacterium]|jgi:N utilization substance protein A|nr:transcription termination factor NusA [Rickettsiales bacterium]